MNILFHKMRTGKKGQIASILTMTLVIFIIAAFIVVNLGKRQIQDSKIRNAARAGVLAGGSTACVLLNSMSNLNDNMILNFAGFTMMIQYMIVLWVIDFVKLCIIAASTLVPNSYKQLLDLALAVANILLTTYTIQYMIKGAYKTGDQLKKMIDELNNKLPRQSRDSARQYAFSNFGVDEPKIPFSKSGKTNAWDYSLIETKFDTFMRLLPTTNRGDGDTDNGNRIEFFWNDSRTDHLVKNTVAVITDPVQPVKLGLMRLGDVALNSGRIISYIGTLPGWLIPLMQLGVLLSPIAIASLLLMLVLFSVLTIYLLAMAAVLLILTIAWCICAAIPIFGWAACGSQCIYYGIAFVVMGVAAGFAVAAESNWINIYNHYSPSRIPCFVVDQDAYDEGRRSKFRIQVTTTRATDPSRINYGIYNSNWPFQTITESGTVKGGGIFPPSQEFDTTPHWN